MKTKSHFDSFTSKVWLLGVALSLLIAFPAAGLAQAQMDGVDNEPGVIWGKLDFLTNREAVVDGHRYPYAHNVIIHTRALIPDKRGNVKVMLDPKGYAIEVSLYGIEETDAMTKYFRHDG
jgi:hypothetical protein